MEAQRLKSADQQRAVDAMSNFFVALSEESADKFNSVVAPDFYIFDNGVRFDGDSVMTFVKGLHSSGKHIEWHVTDPDVHIKENFAWIAYVNSGSITSGGIRSEQQWLESAFLERQSGTWKIHFMHSTRVPAPLPTPASGRQTIVNVTECGPSPRPKPAV